MYFTKPGIISKRNSLELAYTSRSVAKELLKMDMDLSNVNKDRLTERLSIPQIQQYINEVETFNTPLVNWRSEFFVNIPEGMKPSALAVSIKEPSSIDKDHLSEASKAFNIVTDNNIVLIYPKDSLASILTKVPVRDILLLIYIRVADVLKDPSIIDSFFYLQKEDILRRLIARLL